MCSRKVLLVQQRNILSAADKENSTWGTLQAYVRYTFQEHLKKNLTEKPLVDNQETTAVQALTFKQAGAGWFS